MVWNGVHSLRIAFFSGEPEVSTDESTEQILITVDGDQLELSRDAAVSLQERIGDALVTDREFFRTAGRHREDGSYEVRRRGADSTGNAKVFRDFAELRRLYERLPESFAAEDVGRTGITGSRRHMLVRHFAEHPAFDCEISTRSPLEATKIDEAPDGKGEATQTGDARAEVEAD